MLKPNKFPDLPRQVVYLPPHDDKYPKLDFSGRRIDILDKIDKKMALFHKFKVSELSAGNR